MIFFSSSMSSHSGKDEKIKFEKFEFEFIEDKSFEYNIA